MMKATFQIFRKILKILSLIGKKQYSKYGNNLRKLYLRENFNDSLFVKNILEL